MLSYLHAGYGVRISPAGLHGGVPPAFVPGLQRKTLLHQK